MPPGAFSHNQPADREAERSRSYGDDLNKIFKPYEVVTVSGIQGEAVGVSSSCDQQVGESAAGLTPIATDGGDHESVAAANEHCGARGVARSTYRCGYGVSWTSKQGWPDDTQGDPPGELAEGCPLDDRHGAGGAGPF